MDDSKTWECFFQIRPCGGLRSQRSGETLGRGGGYVDDELFGDRFGSYFRSRLHRWVSVVFSSLAHLLFDDSNVRVLSCFTSSSGWGLRSLRFENKKKGHGKQLTLVSSELFGDHHRILRLCQNRVGSVTFEVHWGFPLQESQVSSAKKTPELWFMPT